jgi:hypothetical protein
MNGEIGLGGYKKEMTTTSNKASSSLTKKASAVVTLMIITIIAGTIFAAPSLSVAQQQQQQTTTGTAPTTAPLTASLTAEEQREQDRLKRVTTAITQNLEQGQKQINGIVYTPRWSDPFWVQPNSLSLLFVYCLPGEFAESGQEILGGSELEVLESYSLAVTGDLTGWLLIVQNENERVRLPAAVGVICASDANDPQTRILSQQEQIEINNIIQQFITVRNTVINNVTQIINIINNVTTNGTGGPTNDTGGVTPLPTNDTLTRLPYFTNPVITGTDDITVEATGPEGATVSFEVSAEQVIEGETRAVPVSCDHESGETFPIGETVITCTAQGSVGEATQESFTIRVEEPLTNTVEEPAPTDGEAEPPTNDTGGQ